MQRRQSLKLAIAGLVILAATVAGRAADISGAGATFPFPIYMKWGEAYKKVTGLGVNYQPIGSGGGIKQIQNKTVTFGASDMPLKGPELAKSGLVQFPAVIGGAVPVVNLEGIKSGELKFDGATIARIFLGEIKSWDDPAIRKLNSEANLPAQAISVVHRSDGSGTTFIWADYLSKVNATWRDKVGASTTVDWPVGVGAAGNDGVAKAVAATKGAIGYVEYIYAKQNNLATANLINRDGKVVAPSAASFRAAAAQAGFEKAEDFHVILTDQPGEGTWPAAGASFILMYKQPDDAAASGQALKFFAWAFANGGKLAEDLDFVPLPETVTAAIQTMWMTQIKDANGKPVFAPSN
jgi:phosphate transport system substrate-binding protein